MKVQWMFRNSIFVIFCSSVVSIEPISGFAAGVADVVFSNWYCRVKECCDEKWTNHAPELLQSTLQKQLIGQHLALRIVANTVLAHLKKEKPEKALVLSFHGSPGTGKSFVGNFIADLVYKKGTSSNYVHKYISVVDFLHHQELKSYKDRLKKEIENHTYVCERSLFIFDEVGKMPEGLLDVLTPYVGYHKHIKNIDYRKNIFIFIGNIGGSKINKFAFNHFQEGKSRESITIKQMEEILSVGAFNMEGGFKNSNLISEKLVDFFVPFLPMEIEHVKLCVKACIAKRGFRFDDKTTKKIVNDVINDLEYVPKESPLFSNSGCKNVEKKFDSYFNEYATNPTVPDNLIKYEI